jgi:predicted metalloprotease with PDZ domain
MHTVRSVPTLICFIFVFTLSTAAQSPGPAPLPMPLPVPPPQDRAYPGTIQLQVDATDLDHRIFAVHEVIPVTEPGAMILLYPQWLPGNHAPNGPIQEVGGLMFHSGGKRLAWTRDPANVFAFRLDIPQGATTLEVDFQRLTPVAPAIGRITITPEMLDLQWNGVVLYPAAYFSRDINVTPSLTLPDGWQFGTALVPGTTRGATTTFQTTTLNTLIDSPVYAGRYFKRFDLDPGGPAPVHLDVVADRPDDIAPAPDALAAHRALVQQAYKLFGSHHYDHYDFLFSLSDALGGNGLEHHQSSENGLGTDYFTAWDQDFTVRDLLAHEFTHSWNGKFRRPANLWTANYNVPKRDTLLWVYEGQTQYWGYVLAARSGLWTKQQALDALANVAASYDHAMGRVWRQLEDTTNDPIIANRRPQSWRSWQRSEDYYSEGQLIWLDADTLIRDRSNGAKSLDDFARHFFGIDNGSYTTVTYLFDDVVKALNDLVPYEWGAFLTARLQSHGPGAPLDGISRGGYRLVYTTSPSAYTRAREEASHDSDLMYSIGAIVTRNAMLSRVLWDGPLFKAGLTDGATILAINGVPYDADLLKRTIAAAAATSSPIDLTMHSGRRVWTVHVDYHGGLRYPHLERVAATPARLDDILTPRG